MTNMLQEDEVENSQKTQEDVQQETEATESATKDESEVDASKKDVDGTSPVHNSATITPAEGHRAPPPTPASLAAAIENGTTHLEAVPEDEPMVLTGPSSPMKAESLDATSGNSKPTNKLDVDIKDEAKLTSDLDVAPNHGKNFVTLMSVYANVNQRSLLAKSSVPPQLPLALSTSSLRRTAIKVSLPRSSLVTGLLPSSPSPNVLVSKPLRTRLYLFPLNLKQLPNLHFLVLARAKTTRPVLWSGSAKSTK